ncbi:neutral zinc metallopeptidase [Marihabitans asiaticum]|uniref:Neutral zinc metallopeptidase n=1 Tax=Marihabitans asiaticum TaxID=415218 RepID=A0A560WAW1_9MICO|nr:neutral zinc metallopeptidase [Marihabitans asiaticum]TWD14789.1 hypothetical protein FB557_2214 [Marihabitans asiaticum]
MSFNDNASLDTSRMGGGGGGGRGPVIAGGGGIVGLIVAVVYFLFTGNLPGGDGGQSQAPAEQGQQQGQGSGYEECRSGADANESRTCLMVGGENSLYDYWSNQPDLKQGLGDREFPNPTVNIYSGQTQSQCGTASNQVGPFYCPLDQGIYIDTDFFDIMERQLGAEDGPLAELYVLAHEYGHHIQNLYGVLEESQKDPKGANSGAVRVELMADCFAGMWVQDAATTKDKNGNTLLEQPTEEQIRNALGAAKSVGDDTIQKRSGGGVNPDGWTHGSAQARQGWFIKGMQAENINQCDTFEVDNPENV